MASSNRAEKLTKLQKVLKKHFKGVAPPGDRPVLEHMLYGCCLENAPFEQADEALARLQSSYFDWNELRVTTLSELSEALTMLPNPSTAAANIKRCLQGVFEANYSYDLEPLKKQNQGKAIKELEKYLGCSPFALAYTVQNALGGHAIALDQATLELLLVIGVITETEAAKQQAPGLERAAPKSKGVEFFSLLHQLAAEYHAGPHSPRVRGMIVEIDPDAKDRLPKRGGKKADEKAEESPAEPPAPAAKPRPPRKKATSAAETQAAAKARRKTPATKGTDKSSPKGLTKRKPK